MWIDIFYISPDNALHLYTAFIYDCDYFLIHDRKIIKNYLSTLSKG